MSLEQRKRLRLRELNYSEHNVYFLTLCCRDRKHLLGEIRKSPVGDGVLDVPPAEAMVFTRAGKIVDEKIREMSEKFDGVSVEKYVVMPNHIHMLLAVEDGGGTSRTPSPTGQEVNRPVRTNEKIPSFVSYLKRSTQRMCGSEIWQRGYHDHVVRDMRDLQNHWNYIDTNPLRWELDKYYT